MAVAEAWDQASPTREWPSVSVVMPVLNGAKTLTESVGEVLAQAYEGDLELILALGPSKDHTDYIAHRLAASDPRIRLVQNPSGRTPAGLNAALRAASHDIVVRVDAHGLLSPGYLARAVDLLLTTGAANVGGLMLAVGQTAFEQAVARAYRSWIGLGGGSFHVGGTEGPADSVYLGVFRRDVLERLGGFDEHYHRAQDWELNLRIRRAGEVVWFSPDLSVTYRPRSSWPELARQFFHTGRWRREVIRQYPDTVNPRYLAPPVVTAMVISGAVAGLAGRRSRLAALRWGWLAPVAYLAGLVSAAAVDSRQMSLGARAWFPVVLATIHLSWGAGFLVGERPSSPAHTARTAR
jgi:succinoglycan biosynthesis protein ExoA